MAALTPALSIGTASIIGESDNFEEINFVGDQCIVDIYEESVTSDAYPLPEVSTAPAVMASSFEVNPYATKTWTPRDERKFDDLAFKKALFQTTQDEDRELANMIAARRRDLPGRTAGEIMRTAEHDRLLREMNEVLSKYHAFTSKNRPSH